MTSHGEFYADKIMDLANLGAAALVFGQIAEGRIAWLALLGGVIWLLFCCMLSYFLRKGAVR